MSRKKNVAGRFSRSVTGSSAKSHLTPDQQGSILADCDVGNVRLSIDDAKIKTLCERRHHCTAQLGDSRTPAIDLTSDVGDIRIDSFDPAATKK